MVTAGGTIEVILGPSPNEVYWRVCTLASKDRVEPYWCDCIEPYYESCEHGATPWLRVTKGGVVIARVNAQHLDEIRYLKP